MTKKLLSLFSIFLLASCHASLNKMTLLRSPEKLAHAYSYEEVNSEAYLNFKNKMRQVSSKLSESVIKRNYEDDKNITLSPLSIELCLGLAISGSSNETREELLNIFDMDYQTFNQYYKTYFNQLSLERKQYDSNKIMSQLLLTNSIWIDDDVTLKDSGLDALRDDYYCYSYHVDFKNDNKRSNKAIQEFINDKTKGLINPELKFSVDTLFVLMNTLYLKDIWNDLGDDLPYASNEYKFTNANKEQSNKQLLDGYYFDGRTLKTSDYESFYTQTESGFKLYFVKPTENKNLKDIFNKETIDYVLDNNHYIYKDDMKLEKYHTETIFPEFKASCDLELKDILKEDYNVKTLFDISTCKFNNLTERELFCSSIRHIAKLDVNKKGIEGAAVTMMAMEGNAFPGDVDYQDIYETFVVDKEFGFILTYQDNDVLFSGTVTNID